ncbi:MAG: trypsin-like peptidase domain-containing protein [Deltaproteobacteria bacterium]|nr:trypsin-like peptidase domain-containing protein [Deltaproteobacteria bacterium]
MTHSLGSVISERTPITGTFEFTVDFSGRFVMLHFDELALSATGRLEVELGYDRDVFTADAGPDVWTRPIDPRLGPIRIRVTGGIAVLREYARANRVRTGTPGTHEGSFTNPDPFFHSDPYAEPDYETRLLCNPEFAWENAACASLGAVQERVAASVGIAFYVDGLSVGSCTGTLIGDGLFLTSRHCFTDPAGAEVKSASVTFDYQTLCSPEGGKPPSHSPQFFKVVAEALSGAPATGRSPGSSTDWVILRLDAAPGALPPALPLRDSMLMGPETVFTMHHPNGAAKKTQAGTWDGLGSIAGFDFAGGSSGSALFDAAGRVLRGPLSTGSSCSTTFAPLDRIIDALENPPAPPTPLDVMVVFDRSGSMAASAPPIGQTKLEEAQEAAVLFSSLVRSGSGHRLGLVSFNSSATLDQALGLIEDVREPLVGRTPTEPGKIGDLVSGGSTGLGRGVETALTALGSDTGNQRVILLLSDGLQNSEPLIQDREGAIGDTRLCIIGFGSDGAIDGPLLNRIARDHGGQFTRAVDGLTLRKFFGICFGEIFGSGALMDPHRILRESEEVSEPIPFSVCGEEQVTVILGWDRKETPLRARISTPGSHPVPTDTRVEGARGSTWAFQRLDLPYETERDGTWQVVVDRLPTSNEFPRLTDVEYFVCVVTAGGPSLVHLDRPGSIYTGDTLRPRVGLHYPNRTAPKATVELTIDTPDAALGAVVAENGLVEPVIDEDPLSPFQATVQRIASSPGGLPIPRRKTSVSLHDHGEHDDGALEPDGIYGNILEEITRFEGTYEFHAKATYGEGCVATREVFWSVHVEPSIDSGQSTLDLIDSGVGEGGRRKGVLVIFPRDHHGNPLGPGRSDRFTVSPLPGGTLGSHPEDRGDGSYGVDVDWDATVLPSPGIIVSQPDRDPVVITSEADSGPALPSAGCSGWMFWLLAFFLLSSLILLILLLT